MKPGIYIFDLITIVLRKDGTFDIGGEVGPPSLNFKPLKNIKSFLKGNLYVGEV